MNMKPRNERPVLVHQEIDLYRSDEFAIWITGIYGYSSGVEFRLCICKRDHNETIDVHGFGRPPGHNSSGQVLLGLEFSDGDTLSNAPGHYNGDLMFEASLGGTETASTTLFAQKMPSPGTIRIHFAWPYYGIAEKSTAIESSAIIEACKRAEVLWGTSTTAGDSEVKHDSPVGTQNFPVVLPSGGWFERTVAASQPQSPPGDSYRPYIPKS